MRSKNENLCNKLANEEVKKVFSRKEHFARTDRSLTV